MLKLRPSDLARRLHRDPLEGVTVIYVGCNCNIIYGGCNCNIRGPPNLAAAEQGDSAEWGYTCSDGHDIDGFAYGLVAWLYSYGSGQGYRFTVNLG